MSKAICPSRLCSAIPLDRKRGTEPYAFLNAFNALSNLSRLNLERFNAQLNQTPAGLSPCDSEQCLESQCGGLQVLLKVSCYRARLVQIYGHVSALPTRSFSTPNFSSRSPALYKRAIERETLNKNRLTFADFCCRYPPHGRFHRRPYDCATCRR